MEVIDIDLNDIGATDIPSSNESVNFGGGIELLMNDKKKSDSNKVDLGELDNLEQELNNLSSEQPQTSATSNPGSSSGTKQLSGLGGFSNLFGFNKKSEPVSSSTYESDAGLGHATKESVNDRGPSTWDGFTKVSGDVPMKSTNNLTGKRKTQTQTYDDKEIRRMA